MHAKLPPSGAERWLNCTASPGFVDSLIAEGRIPKETDSVWSIEGTEAHDWASKVLKGQTKISSVPGNFRPHIKDYVAMCRAVGVEAGKGAKIYIEKKVPLFYSPEETGTTDYGAINPKTGVFVRDLKYGAGVPVEAEDNPQLAIYGISIIEQHETFYDPLPSNLPVSIGIHQPRYRGEESLKIWDTTVGKIKEQFLPRINATVKRINSAKHFNELEFKATPKGCRFCPARAICPTNVNTTFQEFPGMGSGIEHFTNMDTPVEAVPMSALVTVYNNRKEIKKFLEDTEAYLKTQATSGKMPDGLKLVAGRQGNRKWTSEDDAREFLVEYLPEDEVDEHSIIGPKTAEELLKPFLKDKTVQEAFDKFVSRPPGKPSLAPLTDKRPALVGGADLFESLGADDTE